MSEDAWATRLQDRANDAVDRVVGTLLDAQRVLSALPSVAPGDLNNQLASYWQAHGPQAYRTLTDGSTRYWVRMTLLGAEYATEWLRETVPPHRMAGLGAPPPVPVAPGGADPLQWLGWYVLVAGWSAQHQAWTARAYEALRDELASGALRQEDVQASAQHFLDERLPDLLGELAELGMDLVADGVAAADDSVQALADRVLGDAPRGADDVLVVDVAGEAGTDAATEIAIENGRDEPAEVTCRATASGPVSVRVTPERFRLDAGGAQRVRIAVALPDEVGEQVAVGRVEVSGHGAQPLHVLVRATTRPSRPRLSIRALESPPPDAAPADDPATDS